MEFSEYAELAQRTASTKTNEDKIGHGCLGLIGEAGEIVDIIKKMKYMGMPKELAREKLIDEVSDLEWYIVEFAVGAEIPFEYIERYESEIDERLLLTAALGIVYFAEDLAEDNVLHNQATQNAEWILEIYNRAKMICNAIGVTLEEVWEHNIAKLKRRYPDGFSAERSNERYEGGESNGC